MNIGLLAVDNTYPDLALMKFTKDINIFYYIKYRNVYIIFNMIFFCYICLYKNFRYGCIEE